MTDQHDSANAEVSGSRDNLPMLFEDAGSLLNTVDPRYDAPEADKPGEIRPAISTPCLFLQDLASPSSTKASVTDIHPSHNKNRFDLRRSWRGESDSRSQSSSDDLSEHICGSIGGRSPTFREPQSGEISFDSSRRPSLHPLALFQKGMSVRAANDLMGTKTEIPMPPPSAMSHGRSSRDDLSSRKSNSSKWLFAYQGADKTEVSSVDLEGMLCLFEKMTKQGAVFWADCERITPEELARIAQAVSIHELTVEDVPEQGREKNELFEHYRHVVLTEMRFQSGSNILEYVNINILVFEKFVLSFHALPVFAVEKVSAALVRGRMQNPDWIMYAFLDSIADSLQNFVQSISREIETLDELVLILTGSEQTDLLRRVADVRLRLVNLRGHLQVKKDVAQSLLMRENIPFVSLLCQLYLRNVYDQLTLMLQTLSFASDTLNNLTSTYLARVSIEVALASNQMNDVMKKFNAVATLMLPLTLLAGLFGMNVSVPGETVEYIPFFLIVGFCALFCILGVVMFKKSGWL
mmetsp:Transcript_16893/g.43112  ORF Transcript_16893/g.43112 Transcript_16893/m.43112 type:complete len:522 (+) Transcript_16893:66-1631(+)|eukprot:CAMPEP_0177659502 /NCGR_PEP_ID=MMETSP0447-20121125/17480_1 /TAXON_ID=0 /ORGANISM="Stygamoeba regulata, Strain BSH-02190019" /LENGTH=521 /DNA_ID=CAMNT_0019164383 /DNA_START=37 /DNA_END=1602 /DNA_ORIENTATION=+